MWLIIYFLIGWFIYSFLREIIFNRNEGISILEYTIENGITPEELDFELFVLYFSSVLCSNLPAIVPTTKERAIINNECIISFVI